MSTLELVNTGILVGIIHVVTGPDHLSAIATLSGTNLSGDSDNNKCHAFLLGIRWGIGHSFGVLVAGCILIALAEPGSEWILISDEWSMILEGVVGVFTLALGFYGMNEALRRRKKSSVNTPGLAPGVENVQMQRNYSSGSGSRKSQVEVIQMPISQIDARSDDSITHMMKDVLGGDNRHVDEHIEWGEPGRRKKNEDEDDIEESDLEKYLAATFPQKAAGALKDSFKKAGALKESFKKAGAPLTDSFKKVGVPLKDSLKKVRAPLTESFIKYQANRPSLKRAKSLVRVHSVDDSFHSRSKNSRSDRKKRGFFCSSTTSTLALFAGVLHGAAAPAAVLGVIPRVQLQDPKLATIYLSVFCLTSTIVMGGFAAFYGSFSEWLAGGRRGLGDNREFLVEAGSSFLSIAVGTIWLALLWTGELDQIFMYDAARSEMPK